MKSKLLTLSILFLAITSRPQPVITGFQADTITNSIGNPAKRLTFTVSGQQVGLTSYILTSQTITNTITLWQPIGGWLATADTQTVIHTNAQNFVMGNAFFKIEQL